MLAAGHPDLRGVALNCVGLAQFELGEFDSAVESHQRAKDLSWRSDVRGFASLRANLAKIAAGESVAYPEVWEVDSAPGQLAALARSVHPHLAPAAGAELGRLLRDEQYFLLAIPAYRAVVDSGHPGSGRGPPRHRVRTATPTRPCGTSSGRGTPATPRSAPRPASCWAA